MVVTNKIKPGPDSSLFQYGFATRTVHGNCLPAKIVSPSLDEMLGREVKALVEALGAVYKSIGSDMRVAGDDYAIFISGKPDVTDIGTPGNPMYQTSCSFELSLSVLPSENISVAATLPLLSNEKLSAIRRLGYVISERVHTVPNESFRTMG